MTGRRARLTFVFAIAGCAPAPVEPTRPNAPVVVSERGCPARPPASKSDLQALETMAGKRISKTCLYGVAGDDPIRADATLRSRPGRRLSLADVREDVRTRMASDRFEDVEISATAKGDEALVFIQLRERPPIGEVAIEGAAILQKEGLKPKFAAAEGKPILISNVYEAATYMRDEYHRRGYRSVAIDVVADPPQPNRRMRVKIVVVEGKPFKFGQSRLNGAVKSWEAELKREIHLEPGTAFDDDKVLWAARRIEEFCIDHGYPTAGVIPSIGEAAADGTIPVSFDITKGDLARFGQVSIAGLESAKLKAPTVKLKSKQGDTFSRAVVDEDVRALAAAFAGRGEKVVVVPRRELDPKKRTVDVIFQVASAPP